MVTGTGPNLAQGKHGGIDRIVLRLAVFGVLLVAAFIALFSRLWFLQVLAVEDYRALAKENRVRFVHSEPQRGRILDRNGNELVGNRRSLAVTIDRQTVDTPREENRVLRSLSALIRVPVFDLERRLNDAAVSPYKPVVVANDVGERAALYLSEHQSEFPGVATEKLPIRSYPEGPVAAHVLGYVAEISEDELKSDFVEDARPRYRAGDFIGKMGVERTYDRILRGRPRIEKVIVNSAGQVVGSRPTQPERPGRDVTLSLDLDIQRITEQALMAGVEAARSAGYNATGGGAVVLDPNTGGVVAMASYPTFDPSILADGITSREYARLGTATPNDPSDDALLNRPIQAQRAPASTFKVVTAGAALATGIADVTTTLDCPGAKLYPPNGEPGATLFRNWTSLDLGFMGFPESLEQSCDTFYYELGWRMEDAFGYGTLNGDETERFQDYARAAGLGRPTRVDLPFEAAGRIPDYQWCREIYRATKDTKYPTCARGWLPGYTVNMAIGQGDVITTPLQMGVTFAAIANRGNVMIPRVVWNVTEPNQETGRPETVREFQPEIRGELPLEPEEIEVIHQGLVAVVAGANGTAAPAFSGFPLEQFPLAGKTGTAERGETELQDAWFVAYGPADAPQYVVSVYVEEAGHGGETAAPIARQIFEGIFGLDDATDVHLSEDRSR